MAPLESDSAQIEVLRVFTDATGGFGTPIGVIRRRFVEHVDPNALAARVAGTQTAVVGAVDANSAELHSYTPTTEVPFGVAAALGAAWWLTVGTFPVTPVAQLVFPAGPVAVSVAAGAAWARFRPEQAGDLTLHQFGGTAEIATVDTADFPDGVHLVWAFEDDSRTAVRARTFASAFGIPEDEANGAAAAALTAALTTGLVVTHGRGSRITTRWESDGTVSVGGSVVTDRIVVL